MPPRLEGEKRFEIYRTRSKCTFCNSALQISRLIDNRVRVFLRSVHCRYVFVTTNAHQIQQLSSRRVVSRYTKIDLSINITNLQPACMLNAELRNALVIIARRICYLNYHIGTYQLSNQIVRAFKSVFAYHTLSCYATAALLA